MPINVGVLILVNDEIRMFAEEPFRVQSLSLLKAILVLLILILAMIEGRKQSKNGKVFRKID